MNPNLNVSFLRQIQATMFAYLNNLEDALSQILENKKDVKSMKEFTNQAHEITSALNISGGRAITKVAATIEEGVIGLSEVEKRGWDYILINQVTKDLLELTQAFSNYMKELVAGHSDELPVVLWPKYAAFQKRIENPILAPEEFFEISPDFSGEKFTPRPESYLNEVLPGLSQRFMDGLLAVEVSNNQEELELGIRKCLEVLDKLYSLRHRRTYQVLWLLVRARLCIGLLEPESLFKKKESWVGLLKGTGIEVRRFQVDHRSRKISPEMLYAILKPMLAPWPENWTLAHPVLNELNARLGLSLFWDTVKSIKENTNSINNETFSKKKNSLIDSLNLIEKEWGSFVSVSSPEHRRRSLLNFLRNLAPLMNAKEFFPGNLADPLFDGLRNLGDRLAPSLKNKDAEVSPVSDIIAYETAATLLLMKEVVERNVRWNEGLESRVRTQNVRLNLALDDRRNQLKNIPYVRWDDKWKEKKVNQALRQVYSVSFNKIGLVEKALNDLVKEDEDDVRESSSQYIDSLETIAYVMKLLQMDEASKLLIAVRQKLSELFNSHARAKDFAQLAVPIASLMHFFKSSASGELDPVNTLEPGIEFIFGKGSFGKGNLEGDFSTVENVSVEEVSHEPILVSEPKEVTPEVMAIKRVTDENMTQKILNEGVLEKVEREEITEIFLEEAADAIGESVNSRKTLLLKPRDEEAWQDLRRQFHTLKGSARISGYPALGEVAWWIEERLNDSLLSKEYYGEELNRALEISEAALLLMYKELLDTKEVFVKSNNVYEIIKSVPIVLTPNSIDVVDELIDSPEDMDVDSIWSANEVTPSEESSVESIQKPENIDDLVLDVFHDEQIETSDEEDSEILELVMDDLKDSALNIERIVMEYENSNVWDFSNLHVAVHSISSLTKRINKEKEADVAKRLEAIVSSHDSSFGISQDFPSQSLPNDLLECSLIYLASLIKKLSDSSVTVDEDDYEALEGLESILSAGVESENTDIKAEKEDIMSSESASVSELDFSELDNLFENISDAQDESKSDEIEIPSVVDTAIVISSETNNYLEDSFVIKEVNDSSKSDELNIVESIFIEPQDAIQDSIGIELDDILSGSISKETSPDSLENTVEDVTVVVEEEAGISIKSVSTVDDSNSVIESNTDLLVEEPLVEDIAVAVEEEDISITPVSTVDDSNNVIENNTELLVEEPLVEDIAVAVEEEDISIPPVSTVDDSNSVIENNADLLVEEPLIEDVAVAVEEDISANSVSTVDGLNSIVENTSLLSNSLMEIHSASSQEERDLAWEKALDGIEMLKNGVDKLAEALILLNKLDYRD